MPWRFDVTEAAFGQEQCTNIFKNHGNVDDVFKTWHDVAGVQLPFHLVTVYYWPKAS